MRRRDQSIRTYRSINPIPDQDFTVADKYPEKEKKITIPDLPDTFIKEREKIAELGFVPMPMSARRGRSAKSRGSGGAGGIPKFGLFESEIGIPEWKGVSKKLAAGSVPVGQVAGQPGLWARFLAWIKKIFGG